MKTGDTGMEARRGRKATASSHFRLHLQDRTFLNTGVASQSFFAVVAAYQKGGGKKGLFTKKLFLALKLSVHYEVPSNK